jgi:hypothetical protein
MSTSEQSKPETNAEANAETNAETNAEAPVEPTKPELTEEQLEKISGGALNLPWEPQSPAGSGSTNPMGPKFY